MTPQRVSVGTVLTERIVRIPVEEGQKVKRGDILIVLDDSDERAAIAQAQAAVAQAEARTRQLREVGLPAAVQALAQAQANLVLAQQQYERAQDLKAKAFVSQSALDDAKRNLDVAQSQLDAARLQVETNRPSGSDYLVAQTALAQARATLESAQARLDQTVIRAPVDGTLIGRNVEPGDVVQPGKELMVLAPIGETQIVVQIDEKNLSQLKLGQKALGSADAYPRETVRGRALLHQPRHRRAARLGRGQAPGSRAAGVPAAGHDGVGRHRGRAARERARDSLRRRVRRRRRAAVGARGRRPPRGAQTREAGAEGRRPRRGAGRRRPRRPAGRRRRRGHRGRASACARSAAARNGSR